MCVYFINYKNTNIYIIEKFWTSSFLNSLLYKMLIILSEGVMAGERMYEKYFIQLHGDRRRAGLNDLRKECFYQKL